MKNKKGFTFIETLIVMGIITLLATAVVVTVNPTKRFEDARDKQREIHLQAILNAVNQRRAVTGQDCENMPNGVDEETSMPIFQTIGTADGNYDLFSCLVPFYLDNALFDPAEGSKEDTKYEIWRNPYTNRVTVRYVKKPQDIFAGPEEYWIFGVPVVETGEVPEDKITHFTAEVIDSEVKREEGSSVFESGVIWHTNDTLDYNSNLGRTTDSSGVAKFSSTITGLTPNTTYYVRAYAKNDIGVGYGEVNPLDGFKTLSGAPAVRTEDADHVTYNTAQLRGTILTIESKPVTAYFCWDENSSDIEQGCPNYIEAKVGITTAPYFFSKDLYELEEGLYYFKACGKVSGDFRCGEIKRFEPKVSAPYVVTLSKDQYQIGSDYAVVKGQIVSSGGLEIEKLGFCYSSKLGEGSCGYDPYTSVKCVDTDAADYNETTGYFTARIPNPTDPVGLEPGNRYNVCAFASNGWEGDGLSYGGSVSFDVNPTKPSVTVKGASRKASSSEVTVKIEGEGGRTIDRWGVCWLSYSDPINLDPTKLTTTCTRETSYIKKGDSSPTTIDVYNNGLWADTSYKVRAYAHNEIGTGWSDPVTDLPTTGAEEPRLTTKTLTDEDIEITSVKSGGNISDHGGANIVELGVCWSLAQDSDNPKKENEDGGKVKCKTGSVKNLGPFDVEVTVLSGGEEYYIQAYAKNSGNKYGYGGPIFFQTDISGPPVVGSTELGGYGLNWRAIKGSLISNGGDPTTEIGVCYSLEESPTYGNSSNIGCLPYTGDIPTTIDEGEPFNFEIQIPGLTPSTTYYALVYAHNNASTVHGYPVVSFGVYKCKVFENGQWEYFDDNTDPFNQCPDDQMNCEGSCKRVGPPGYCYQGACKGEISENPPSDGAVCNSATNKWDNKPSANAYCSTGIYCVQNSCSAKKFYRGCTVDGTCSNNQTNWVEHTDSPWKVPTNNYNQAISQNTGWVENGTSCTVADYLTCGTCQWCERNTGNCKSQYYFQYRGIWVTYETVYNSSTGKCWMQRNLGATKVAGAYNDSDAYGHLFQWGRGDDGHQLRNSSVVNTCSSSFTPGVNWINYYNNWLCTSNNTLWNIQPDGSIPNNPCPAGWRIPTIGEWQAEVNTWSSQDRNGAILSLLRLPSGGRRQQGGSLWNVGEYGYCWSSTSYGNNNAYFLYFFSGNLIASSYMERVNGMPVRCIKN